MFFKRYFNSFWNKFILLFEINKLKIDLEKKIRNIKKEKMCYSKNKKKNSEKIKIKIFLNKKKEKERRKTRGRAGKKRKTE